MNNEEEKNIEEEKAAKKKLMEDFARQNALPMDGLEITPEGELRVKYGTAYDWAIAHGCTPINEVLKRLDEKYFGENDQD